MKYEVDIKTFHKLALDIINMDKQKIQISPEWELKYIIEEYFNSFAINNKKANVLYRKVIKHQDANNLKLLISSFINIYKANYSDISYLFKLYKKSIFINKYYYKIILDIYLIYLRELESSGKYDFNDLIIHAASLITNRQRKVNYKLIIVDEFQDTSLIRFNLVRSILQTNKAKIFAVGDDYQSIYRFSGCDLSLFINFDKLIDNVKKIYLNHNYRNNQSLVNVANRFIMKNKLQLSKNTICHKDSPKCIKIIFYHNKSDIIKKVTKNISGNILILGRNNFDKKDFNIEDTENIRFLTIHKAKGLEEDNVVLINLYNKPLGFPSKIRNEKIISKILKNDYVIYEEERRLFYVALTRTRNNIYLLTPYYNYSEFIKELIKDYKKDIEIIHID